ncbi:hypothetical protein EA473_16490 [Natrarchaeobius chitinivorans]|uniref:Uncharacterized protein n=1 Tax=Natrarchaeobius chitinivorans TaxID=1679083 RepID=A0A3N6P3N6_NATCH|nr:hypothetical protein EA473_16490 [Natrarchaeobius chitinivorans]
MLVAVTLGLFAIVFFRVQPAFSLLAGVVAVLSVATAISGRFRAFVDDNRWAVFGSLLVFMGIVLAAFAISYGLLSVLTGAPATRAAGAPVHSDSNLYQTVPSNRAVTAR